MNKITVSSPEAQSLDLISNNIEQLKVLFPELITEDQNGIAVNIDVLKALVGDNTITDSDEKYGLNWHGKRLARQLALTPSNGTLRPCPKESVAWDTTQNLMIEGDNLEVLKLLQKSYAGKVKLIYIDPPYNTGKDFIYPDNFQDNIKNYMEMTGQLEGGQKISSNTETSGRFHAYWLNMMYPRLKLARNLLGEKGVIFMSIDDREVANLRKLGDEIFGEENFIANIMWQKKYTRSNDAKWFSDNHDHILVYAKCKDLVTLNGQERNKDQLKAYTNPDKHPKGKWKATPLHAKSGANTNSFTFNNGVVWTPSTGTFRRFNDLSMQQMDEANEIWFGQDGRQIPQRKSFLSEVKEGITPVTLWPYQEVGHNHEANNNLKALGLVGIFDNPKPVRLLQRITHLVTNPDQEDITLDFFAGSGTLGEAVLQQNLKDGGKRKYILVQLPEKLNCENSNQKVAAEFCDEIASPRNIAELTKERLRRASTKIKTDNPQWQGDTGFRVFKLDNSNIRAWNPHPEDLATSLFENQDHLLEGRTEEDILYELLLKLGLDLCVAIEERNIANCKVHSVGSGVLIACLAEQISHHQLEDLAQGIINWHNELTPVGDTTCIFRDSAFSDDVVKVNLTAILEQYGIKNIHSL